MLEVLDWFVQDVSSVFNYSFKQGAVFEYSIHPSPLLRLPVLLFNLFLLLGLPLIPILTGHIIH